MDPTADDAHLSLTLAREAGALLLQVRASFGSIAPDDRENLRALRDTADRESHLLLERRLAQERPDDALLSEEGVDDEVRLGAPRVWIVDPLDGTWEYGQGRPDFAVHVALWTASSEGGDPAVVGGSLRAAAVDLPAQDVAYSTLDPVPEARGLPRHRPVRVVASRSRPPQRLAELVAGLSERLAAGGFAGGVEVVEVGSVGAKAGELLAGRAEIYVHDSGFYEWDLAAPLGVALHRGFWCAAPDGSGFDFNQMPPWEPGVTMAVPSVASALRAVLGA